MIINTRKEILDRCHYGEDRSEEDKIRLLYEWAKTGVINLKEFKILFKHLTII